MPSDPQTPRRMPWEEYRSRIVGLVDKVLALEEGKFPDNAMRTEAGALFGYQAQNVLHAIQEPPWMCPRCGRSHHGWEALCYECDKATKAEASEAAIRADERAKVRAELAQKGGA